MSEITFSLDLITISLTNAGVPPEDVPVKDVEGEVSEATWDLAVEVLPIERTEEASNKNNKATEWTHLLSKYKTQTLKCLGFMIRREHCNLNSKFYSRTNTSYYGVFQMS